MCVCVFVQPPLPPPLTTASTSTKDTTATGTPARAPPGQWAVSPIPMGGFSDSGWTEPAAAATPEGVRGVESEPDLKTEPEPEPEVGAEPEPEPQSEPGGSRSSANMGGGAARGGQGAGGVGEEGTPPEQAGGKGLTL